MKKFLSALLLMVLIFCFLAGPVLAYLGYGFIQKGKETLNWVATTGKILESATHEVYSTTPGSVNNRTWQPDITYQYDVNGETFQGQKIRVFIVYTGNPERAEGWANKYPAGTELTVYYDPEDPYRSVLEQGVQTGAYLMTALGAGMFLFVIGYIIYSKKRSAQPQNRIP